MNKLLWWVLLGCCLGISSCSSHKKLVRPKVSLTTLSQQLGFKVHPKDDLSLYTEAVRWLGVPYRHGGTSRSGVDCSGLVGQIYKNAYRVSLERTVAGIESKNSQRIQKNDLRPGDLVFFNTSKNKRGVNHVGIYLKNKYFIHASASRGVIVSHLQEEYYRKHWKKGGRVKNKKRL